MMWRPFGSVNCSKAIRPACADSTPGIRVATSQSGLIRGSNSGKKRERVGLEDGPTLGIRKWQGQELIDVLPQILYARAGPVGAPQHALDDLRQAGKEPQQLGGRNPRNLEPTLALTSHDHNGFLPVDH